MVDAMKRRQVQLWTFGVKLWNVAHFSEGYWHMLDKAVVRKEIVEMTVLDIVVGICPRSMRTRTMSSTADLETISLDVKTLDCLYVPFC